MGKYDNEQKLQKKQMEQDGWQFLEKDDYKDDYKLERSYAVDYTNENLERQIFGQKVKNANAFGFEEVDFKDADYKSFNKKNEPKTYIPGSDFEVLDWKKFEKKEKRENKSGSQIEEEEIIIKNVNAGQVNKHQNVNSGQVNKQQNVNAGQVNKQQNGNVVQPENEQQRRLREDAEMRRKSEIEANSAAHVIEYVLEEYYRDEKRYGTENKGDWKDIETSMEAFLNNFKHKSDFQRGADLAEMLQAAQRYQANHSGYKYTQKSKERYALAALVADEVSNILKNLSLEGRVIAVDAILERQKQVLKPGDADTKELYKEFFADYAKNALREKRGDKTGGEEFITDKTFMIMHYDEKEKCFKDSSDKITGGLIKKTIFSRTRGANALGKNIFLTRKGDIRPEDANDAKLTELAVKRAHDAEPGDAPYISRSAFVKLLEQIKITPQMTTREYLDSHYIEMSQMLNLLLLLQNCYTDWGGASEKGKAALKEFRSFPEAIQKKLDVICDFGNLATDYYTIHQMKAGYVPGRGFNFAFCRDLKKAKQDGIIDRINKIKGHNEKFAEIIRLKKKGYDIGDIYEIEETSPGNYRVMDGEEAALYKLKENFEKNKKYLDITEEDLETVRYFSYQEEAQKESRRLGFTVSPKAVALNKMCKFQDDFIKQEEKNPENKPLQRILRGERFNGVYARKSRYINYNKDGQPATEEDRKNLEWNRAYAKSLLENKPADRIRLLKENYEHIADLINRVDFDRLLDFDYWNHNKDLYVNLRNFALHGMDADSTNFQAEPTHLMTLLEDFKNVFESMDGIHQQLGNNLGVDVRSSHKDDKASDYKNYMDTWEMPVDPLVAELNNRIAQVKKSNIEYIASKNKLGQRVI